MGEDARRIQRIKQFRADDKVWEILMGMSMGRYVRAGIDQAEALANGEG